MLNQNEIQRYAKHLSLTEIGKPGQEKLKQSSVLIIGAGGLGCPLAQLLAATGIGKMTIVDGDSVDISNLQRQILFHDGDIGRKKCEVIAEKLHILNPNCTIAAYPHFLDSSNAEPLINNHDVVVDCTDSVPTKQLLGELAEVLNKTLIYGAIHKFEGQVTTFNHLNKYPYKSLFPAESEAALAFTCSDIGVYAILPSIIAGYQANEVLKVLLGLNGILSGKVLYFNALTNKQTIINF